MDGRHSPPSQPGRDPAAVSRRALLRLDFRGRERADIDYDSLTERVRSGWETGASEHLLRALEPVAAAAAGLAGVTAGERVLDAGAGDGNVALECVRRGAHVDACDIADLMVERGRVRCGAHVRWRQGDVQALPYAEGSFDVVVSAFGAALAPHGRRTARELVRVLRPGGRVVLAAWMPEGLPGALDRHLPLPDGVLAPSAWADEETARGRFEPELEALERRTCTVPLRFAGAEEMFDALTLPFGLEEERRLGLRPAFDRLLEEGDTRLPGAEVRARYVLYAGRRPE